MELQTKANSVMSDEKIVDLGGICTAFTLGFGVAHIS